MYLNYLFKLNSCLTSLSTTEDLPELAKLTFNYFIKTSLDHGKEPWIINLEELSKDNHNFRKTEWTGQNLQMTLMSLKPQQEVGLERHPKIDQLLRIESGKARVLFGKEKDSLKEKEDVSDGFAIFIPAGYWHNVINTGKGDLKLYSLYAGPAHPKGTTHRVPPESEEEED